MKEISEVDALQARGIRAEAITTYRDLQRIRDQFVIGVNGYKLPFVIVIGSQGSGKSTMFKDCPNAHYANSAVSPVGLYTMAYRHKDEAIFLDDVDELLRDKTVVALLKALADHGENKLLSWEKRNASLASDGIPSNFMTSSRICIICNELPTVNKNLQAVLDRAKTVIFRPTAQEIHGFVSKWWPAEHSDILDHMGDNLDLIVAPSIRWYEHAQREKLLNNDWRAWLLAQWYRENPRLAVIAELHRNGVPRGKPMEEEWTRRTGLGRAIFYRYQAAYMASQAPAA